MKKMGHKEIFGSDGHFYHLNCDDGIWMYTYVQIHQIIDIKMCSLFVHKLHLIVLKKSWKLQRLSPMFSYRNIIILGFIFGSLIHFELILPMI